MAADANPSFEVATIKPASPDNQNRRINVNGRNFMTENTTLAELIKFAYRINSKQIAGAPGWFDSDKFNIAAVADGAAGGGILGHIGAIAATIFGTNVKRGRLSTGQLIARNVTRSVTDKVVGGVVANLGKSVGGSIGGSIGRSLVRGALGGLLRR